MKGTADEETVEAHVMKMRVTVGEPYRGHTASLQEICVPSRQLAFNSDTDGTGFHVFKSREERYRNTGETGGPAEITGVIHIPVSIVARLEAVLTHRHELEAMQQLCAAEVKHYFH